MVIVYSVAIPQQFVLWVALLCGNSWISDVVIIHSWQNAYMSVTSDTNNY